MAGPHPSDYPDWTRGASGTQAFMRGVREAPSTPMIVLMATFLGFGALAREAGFSLPLVIFTNAAIFALPGQVVLVDQLVQGAGLAATAFAVTLTAVRLLPLTVSLMPLLRGKGASAPALVLASHFIAITVWVESVRRLPRLPEPVRLPYYFGFASTLFTACMVATVGGYLAAAAVPPVLAAALLFLTPIYFFLSLLAVATSGSDYWALALGTVLGPAIYLVAPGLDLLLTGLVGGTIAYGIGRWQRREQ